MRRVIAFMLTAVLAAPVFAHPGHDSMGLLAGALHPLMGLDHLLAAVVVGLWAAQLGGRARWALPLGFVSAMALSAVVAADVGLVMPNIEAGITASLICLGALVAFARVVPLAVAAVVVVAFAAFHGAAHGMEGALGAASAMARIDVALSEYLAGLFVATAALHVAGLLIGLRAAGRLVLVPHALGALTAAAGLTLALT